MVKFFNLVFEINKTKTPCIFIKTKNLIIFTNGFKPSPLNITNEGAECAHLYKIEYFGMTYDVTNISTTNLGLPIREEQKTDETIMPNESINISLDNLFFGFKNNFEIEIKIHYKNSKGKKFIYTITNYHKEKLEWRHSNTSLFLNRFNRFLKKNKELPKQKEIIH